MWIFRYLFPGIVLILLGGFAFQNLNQKVTVRLLYWEFYNVPLILIIGIAFVVGILIRYLAVFTHWMDRRKIEKVKQKLIEARESEVSVEVKEDIIPPIVGEEKESY